MKLYVASRKLQSRAMIWERYSATKTELRKYTIGSRAETTLLFPVLWNVYKQTGTISVAGYKDCTAHNAKAIQEHKILPTRFSEISITDGKQICTDNFRGVQDVHSLQFGETLK